jgi:IclR family transcriptional regulator, acetate operon repressor
VQRALAVLRCFEAGAPALRLSDIARQTGLSASTVHRLLAALCADGLLRHDADSERYRLGPALLVLGQRAAAEAGLDEAAAVLAEVTERTGESAALAVRAGSDAVVVAVSPSHQRLRFDHLVGSRVPVHASAMGKVLLACGDGDLVEAVSTLGHLQRFTPRTHASKAALVAELRTVRRAGWAVNREERYEGVGGIAGRVDDTRGRLVAALGVQAPVSRLALDNPRRVVDAITAGAQRLQGRLDPAALTVP